MTTRDRLLAAIVAIVWGCNFLAIDATIGHLPPLFAGSLRWVVLAVPTMLLVPWPGVRARWLIGYGLGFGTGQFAFLYIGMDSGMPTGLASLVLQASAPFTLVLGAALLAERVTPRQVAGILLSIAGMVTIAVYRAETAALLPVLLTLLGALSWAVGNLSSRQAFDATRNPHGGRINPLHLTLWMSVVPPLPMFALSLVFEGPRAQWTALSTLGTTDGVLALGGMAYTVIIATLVGSGVWVTLMRRNNAGVVAPFSMLVPIVGMTAAFLVLDETPAIVELGAGVAVVTGVLLGSWSRQRSRPRRHPTKTPA